MTAQRLWPIYPRTGISARTGHSSDSVDLAALRHSPLQTGKRRHRPPKRGFARIRAALARFGDKGRDIPASCKKALLGIAQCSRRSSVADADEALPFSDRVYKPRVVLCCHCASLQSNILNHTRDTISAESALRHWLDVNEIDGELYGERKKQSGF